MRRDVSLGYGLGGALDDRTIHCLALLIDTATGPRGETHSLYRRDSPRLGDFLKCENSALHLCALSITNHAVSNQDVFAIQFRAPIASISSRLACDDVPLIYSKPL